ncbi:hypothetical protein [Candidatus Methylacidithermus pantelleriae]|uniref:Uncharacterized protein n=1 Tax=Candidatus Methylacidithermus pantelleriae TaxID=2744239 RepID=A0A8J2FQ73_9BACT|nr:hypothetical protein [Candidatus Methylacidithermus pantelleriae]CAF0698183.1 hypothetical protein MPNT_250019 [Candidatus Methylacidithermus pantelleriae]
MGALLLAMRQGRTRPRPPPIAFGNGHSHVNLVVEWGKKRVPGTEPVSSIDAGKKAAATIGTGKVFGSEEYRCERPPPPLA